MTSLLQRLEHGLLQLQFPISKEELQVAVDAIEAAADLRSLVRAMPGHEFHFASDVLSTARIAIELQIHQPWAAPEQKSSGPAADDDTIAEQIKHGLARCRQTNAHLIRVVVVDGQVRLEGRTPDVPGGVMASRVARAAIPSGGCVTNLLQVLT